MRKRVVGTLLSVSAAALAIGLGTTSAFATAITWKVSPGGSITAKSGTTTLKDTKTGAVLTCTASATTATLKSGSGLAGAGIGSVKTVTFTNCTGPAGLTFKVTTSHLPWKLNAVSYKSGVTHGTITGIHAVLTGTNSTCTATVDGTGATKDNGMVKVTYTNKTGKLAVLPSGGNLHAYKVANCLGALNSGDPTTYQASYAVSPKQTITG